MARMNVFVFLSAIISVALSGVCKPDQRSCSSLLSYLKHFNENRHHVTSPEGKQRARDFIKKTFQDLGLSTWSEEFKPDPVFSQYANGSNIIGMLPGTLAGSPNDRLFLIGAHYDTVRTTAHGADDNGSGVAAMLEVAKQIATDFKNCSRSFSILFVAFDFEEWEDCNKPALYPKCACSKIDCGSRAFVANLSGFYNGSLNSNGKLQGAIIMDTVMNYNDTPNSQVLPLLTGKLLPEVFNQIKADEFRGNFLSVVGRQVDDRALMDAFWYHYSNVKSELNNKTAMYSVNLPFHGQPSNLDRNSYSIMGDFLRSDHVPFWNSVPSLNAIFLSDTADHRGYMTSCYHADCDSVARVTHKTLQFLQKTSDVILAVVNDATKLSCPPEGSRLPPTKGPPPTTVLPQKTTILPQTTSRRTSTSLASPEGSRFPQTAGQGMDTWKPWQVALIAIGMLLIGVILAGAAFVCYLRWAKGVSPLIAEDHVMSNFNPDVSKAV